MSMVGKRHRVRLRYSAGLSGAMHGLLTARNAVLEAIAAIDGVDPGGSGSMSFVHQTMLYSLLAFLGASLLLPSLSGIFKRGIGSTPLVAANVDAHNHLRALNGMMAALGMTTRLYLGAEAVLGTVFLTWPSGTWL
jgi:hypothetical protein